MAVSPRNLPDDSLLPDFTIGGAMKSATTTLEGILKSHPGIHLPGEEIPFYSVDDYSEHPYFFKSSGAAWVNHDWEHDFETYFNWYQRHFDPEDDHGTIGEISTSYLTSSLAPSRIKRVNPDTRLLFLLRNPVNRTYSHYIHFLRNGFVQQPLDNLLRISPNFLLKRSHYEKGLKRYFDLFPSENIKVIIFEEFIRNMQAKVDEILDFIGCKTSIDIDELNTHRHRAKRIRSHRVQCWINSLFNIFNVERYFEEIPNLPNKNTYPIRKPLYRFLCSLNSTRSAEKTPISEETRTFLGEILYERNKGLPELIGRDLAQFWDCFDRENK